MANLLVACCVVSVIFLFTFKETSSQAIAPIGYGTSPMVYNQSDEDNLGMLLTILLLAGKSRNNNGCGQSCNCCNCCSCGNCGECSQSVPIPYPIPFPTNNAIVARPYYHSENDDYDDDDEDDDGKAKDSNSKGQKGSEGSKDQKKGSEDDSEIETGKMVVEEEEESVEEPPEIIEKPKS